MTIMTYIHTVEFTKLYAKNPKSYIGQIEWKLETRYKEHIRYIKGNNEQSAYATHILCNRYDFGPIDKRMNVLHRASKGKRMNILEDYYIQRFYLRNSIIREQTVAKINTLFQLAFNLESRDPRNNPDSSISQPSDTVSC
jgi:hypothetical protein